jgi:hypothetical protein
VGLNHNSSSLVPISPSLYLRKKPESHSTDRSSKFVFALTRSRLSIKEVDRKALGELSLENKEASVLSLQPQTLKISNQLTVLHRIYVRGLVGEPQVPQSLFS